MHEKNIHQASSWYSENCLVLNSATNLLPKKLAGETRLAKSSEFRLSEENFRFAQASFGAKKFKELPNHL